MHHSSRSSCSPTPPQSPMVARTAGPGSTSTSAARSQVMVRRWWGCESTEPRPTEAPGPTIRGASS
eukprot:1972385-Prymnesium_polylepis.1